MHYAFQSSLSFAALRMGAQSSYDAWILAITVKLACVYENSSELRHKMREKVEMAGRPEHETTEFRAFWCFVRGNIPPYVLQILTRLSPSMSVSRAFRSHFIVSANQKTTVKSAQLCTHLNADMADSTAMPPVAKFKKRLDCCSERAAVKTLHGARAMARECTYSLGHFFLSS